MRSAVAILAVLLGASAQARVAATSPAGFELAFEATVPAARAAAWTALVHPERWWDGRHTYSGHAANLNLDPRAGGCWCERLADGGSVEHGRVLLAQPGAGLLRLSAPLGPLQARPVTAVMTWRLTSSAAGTKVQLSYVVAGDLGGPPEAVAPQVDRVLGAQVDALRTLLST